jgi:hypothetical protein
MWNPDLDAQGAQGQSVGARGRIARTASCRPDRAPGKPSVPSSLFLAGCGTRPREDALRMRIPRRIFCFSSSLQLSKIRDLSTHSSPPSPSVPPLTDSHTISFWQPVAQPPAPTLNSPPTAKLAAQPQPQPPLPSLNSPPPTNTSFASPLLPASTPNDKLLRNPHAPPPPRPIPTPRAPHPPVAPEMAMRGDSRWDHDAIRTLAHMHACTRAHTHTYTHTHTHTHLHARTKSEPCLMS